MVHLEAIGKYEDLQKIGEGGFAVVYRAFDPFIKRTVAIKLCTSEDGDLRRRFMREAEIAGNLHHKNIVTIFDFAYEQGRPYLVQEYLPGKDLKQVIRAHELLPVVTKLDYLLQVAAGLRYAHGKGVLHRDVKPANVRVLPTGQVKILDFGIAKLRTAVNPLTQHGVIMGTAGYISPEQVLGRELDARADVFAFGSLAYELLSFEKPFPGSTVGELLQQVMERDAEPITQQWPDCPADLAELISWCLEKDLVRRCPDFGEVLLTLAPIHRRLLEEKKDETLAADSLRAEREAKSGAYRIDDTRPVVLDDELAAVAATTEGDDEEATAAVTAVAGPGDRFRTFGWRTLPMLWQRGRALAEDRLASLGMLPRRVWLVVAAVAAGLLLAIALVVVWGLTRGETPEAEPVAEEVRPPSPPPPVATGGLYVDASPWAEIERVVAADGGEVELEAGRSTPLFLDLAPGRYTVFLTSPGSSSEVSGPAPEAASASGDDEGELVRRCGVTIVAGATVICRESFTPPSAVEYFKAVGWWR